jgi:hypothetical protein
VLLLIVGRRTDGGEVRSQAVGCQRIDQNQPIGLQLEPGGAAVERSIHGKFAFREDAQQPANEWRSPASAHDRDCGSGATAG